MKPGSGVPDRLLHRRSPFSFLRIAIAGAGKNNREQVSEKREPCGSVNAIGAAELPFRRFPFGKTAKR